MSTVDSSVLRAGLEEYRDALASSAADHLLEAVVRPNVPVGADSGERSGPRLIDTQRGPDRIGDGAYSIGYDAEHASYTDEGTEPHEIHGRPWLVFFSERAGRTIFLNDDRGQFVHHPGTARQGWWTDNVTDESWDVAVQEQVDTGGVTFG